MSIHMHDLQVQNKITSKNEIETKKLQASMATIAQLSIQHNEDATTIKGDRVKFDSELDVDGDCHINGELNIGPNFETVVTYNGLAEEIIQIAGYDIKILGGSLETDDLAISLSESSKLIPQKAMSAEALTTTNIGSLSCPVYFDKGGKPQECTNVQAVTAQSAIQADLALKAQTLDVTSTNGVGDFSQPVYFDIDGKPQPCSSVIATKLLDDVNVGAEDTPIYFKGGVPMACTELYAAEAGHADEADVAISAEIALSLRLPDNPENPPETSKKGQVFFKIDYNNSHTIQQENGVWYPLAPYIFIPNT